MSALYTASGKRISSMTHAKRVHVCPCGKRCRGNGGWSSHKKACAVYQSRLAVARTRLELDDLQEKPA
ncbi:MAG: hypothetical protein OSA97_06820 [Nevskia sp.]|nr:hypothetical protein [Nevskia sp.]